MPDKDIRGYLIGAAQQGMQVRLQRLTARPVK